MSEQNTSTAVQQKEPDAANIRLLVQQPEVMGRIQEILGKRASVFAASVVQLVNQASSLKKCEPKSILNCAMVAATLDLSINPQLGQAWVVPYGNTAQFQIGAKGLKQLAMRSGQFIRLNAIEVYENQFKSFNPLTEELIANFEIEGEGKVVGYCAYMKLVNGFEKTVYWTRDKAEKHGKKYSKTFKSGPWASEFDKMAMKTVMKAMLNGGEAPLSIEMQTAINADQAIVQEFPTPAGDLDLTYPDNLQDEIQEAVQIPDNETEINNRALGIITSAKNSADLTERLKTMSPAMKEYFKKEIAKKFEGFENPA